MHILGGCILGARIQFPDANIPGSGVLHGAGLQGTRVDEPVQDDRVYDGFGFNQVYSADENDGGTVFAFTPTISAASDLFVWTEDGITLLTNGVDYTVNIPGKTITLAVPLSLSDQSLFIGHAQATKARSPFDIIIKDYAIGSFSSTLVVDENGDVLGTGYNRDNILGGAGGEGVEGFTPVTTLPETCAGRWVQVAIDRAAQASYALRNDGALFQIDAAGSLVDGSVTWIEGGTRIRDSEPVLAGVSAAGLRGFVKTSGDEHIIALRSDGTIWSGGLNDTGQCGLGFESANVATLTQIGSDSDWVDVAGGYSFSLAVKSDGTLWSWGSNQHSQLGRPATTIPQRTEPGQIGSDTDWEKVSVAENNNGEGSGYAVKSNGTTYAWGWNETGYLSIGSLGVDITTPTLTNIPLILAPRHLRPSWGFYNMFRV